MEWELRNCFKTDAIMDDSGLYVIINRVHIGEERQIQVRADLMTVEHDPVMSFLGNAENVRKALSRFIAEQYGISHPSMEHMAYIGYELLRAETVENFVQD